MIRVPRTVVRRIASTIVVVAVGAGVVAVDARDRGAREGASAAIDRYAGFPQVSSVRRISTSWFCPGVAAGDGVEAGNVVVVNPGDEQITATLRLLSEESTPLERIVVEPRSRLEVDVLRGRTVGVVVPVVELVGPVGTVEQELFYAAGDVTAQCVSQTSSTWHFADGFTAEGSTHRLVIANPYPESAVVGVVFTTVDGERAPAQLQGMILAPGTARSIPLVEQGARDEKRLAVTVTATSGQVVASRAQHYLGAGRLGYSTTLGVPDTGRQWWFTSGRTGPLVTEERPAHDPVGIGDHDARHRVDAVSTVEIPVVGVVDPHRRHLARPEHVDLGRHVGACRARGRRECRHDPRRIGARKVGTVQL